MTLIYGAVSTMFCHYGIDFLLGLFDHVLPLWHLFRAPYVPCSPCFVIMALIYGSESTMFCNYGTDFLLGLVDHVLLLWH